MGEIIKFPELRRKRFEAFMREMKANRPTNMPDFRGEKQYLSTDELIGLAIVKFIREVRKINEAYGVDIERSKRDGEGE